MTKKTALIYCTLSEMIDNDILDHGIGGANTTDGFSLGKQGRSVFHMWDFTKNGYCVLYITNKRGQITGRRYVDATKTMVTVWKREN
jgi:hypothetical protein